MRKRGGAAPTAQKWPHDCKSLYRETELPEPSCWMQVTSAHIMVKTPCERYRCPGTETVYHSYIAPHQVISCVAGSHASRNPVPMRCETIQLPACAPCLPAATCCVAVRSRAVGRLSTSERPEALENPKGPCTSMVFACALKGLLYPHLGTDACTITIPWMFQQYFHRYQSYIGIEPSGIDITRYQYRIEPNRNPRISKPTATPIEHGSKSANRRPGPPTSQGGQRPQGAPEPPTC